MTPATTRHSTVIDPAALAVRGRRSALAAGRARRRGQAVVFTAFAMLAMAAFVIAVVDSAQLVALKIRLQNAADAAALAGATSQARSLNTLASLNSDIADTWNTMYVRCLAPFITPAEAEAELGAGQFIMEGLGISQEALNLTSNLQAEAAAQQYAYLNWKPAWGDLSVEYWANGMPVGLAPLAMTRRCEGFLMYETIYPPAVLMWSGQVMCTRIDQGAYVTYSAVRLTADGGDFITGGGLFGRVQSIQAVAQAKPYGGWLYDMTKFPPINPAYDVKLFPIAAQMGNPVIAFFPNFLYMH